MEKYRLSSYAISIELESEPDDSLLIHGYTGATDLIDKSIVRFLIENPYFDRAVLPCEESTKDALEKRGYITLQTEDEEKEYFKRLATALFRKESILRKGFTFLITYDCNFRCPYCFEKDIQKDGTAFTKEMVDKAYQAILQIAPDERLRSRSITLYGGEPLLKRNKNIISYIIEQGKELGFKFSAISNGYDLKYYEDLLSPEDISFIQITIDGIRERHNQRRIHYQGYPTFDTIVENIGIALNKGVAISVRVNADRNNIEDLEGLQTIFCDLGYTENPLFSINSALLRNYSDSTEKAYQYFSQKDFIEWHKKHGLESTCQDYGVYRRIHAAIKQGKPLSFRSTFCSAQTGGFVFDPFGRIYTCWETVNQKEHCIGNYSLNNDIVWNEQVEERWRKTYLLENAICASCKYALLCGGGCPAQNLQKHRCTHMEDIVHNAANKAYLSIK